MVLEFLVFSELPFSLTQKLLSYRSSLLSFPYFPFVSDGQNVFCEKGKADCSPLFAKQVIFQYLKITLKRSAFFLF